MAQDPKAEYGRRLADRRECAAHMERRHIAAGNLKLAVVGVFLVLLWLTVVRGTLSPWWLFVPGGLFIALLVIHDRVIRNWRCAQRAVAFYEKGLNRIADRWPGSGEAGDRFKNPAHPYSDDLDLFGSGSLFELLCTVRTRSAEEKLASWLLAPAPPEVVRARQQAIRELAPKLNMREDLALLGEDMRSGINPKALAAWCEGPPLLTSRAASAVAALLSLAGVASLAVWAAFDNIDAVLGVAVLSALFQWRLRKPLERVIGGIGESAYGLELVSHVLLRFERERFTSPLLVELRTMLDAEGLPPSRVMWRLHRLLEFLDSRDHLLIRVIDPVVLYTLQLAYAVEAWRRHSGAAVRRWLGAMGEIEALIALANYAYERPADPFPEFSEDSPRFEGEALGHPLLPETRAVRNDVCLGGEMRALVVSGSNMSGKSTLLRTVGVNAVLAMAGAPVRARRLRLSPLAVGASIRTLDSLQGGNSRFYAEIKRLRLLVDVTRQDLPLLFLLDELLQGTNSHDRRIGAEGVVRSLVERGAIGMLTTHDLALAQIAEALAPRAANVHFEDHLEDGKMTFDYRLRPGVVRKSNALELMRSVGLEV